MNGIYDFEKYRAPYLDESMLIERKCRQEKKKVLILAVIASLVMTIVLFVSFAKLYSIDRSQAVMVAKVVAVYVFVTGIAIGIILSRIIRGDKEVI